MESDILTENVAGDQSDAKKAEIFEELMKAGVFYGRKKSKTHPLMRRVVAATRNGVELIDPEATVAAVDEAGQFLKQKMKESGVILFIATQPAAKESVSRLAQKFNLPHVTNRWIGGTLTNFKTIFKRMEYWKKLRSDKASGKLDSYTKKERLNFEREIDKLTQTFGGVETMNRLPDAVFVVSSVFHSTAVREARRLKIPVVAVVSTDADPAGIDYPIPANDNAASSIAWILEKVEKFVSEGIAERESEARKSEENSKEERKKEDL